MNKEHAIQVIHVTVPQCDLVENEWTAPLLKYLSEVHSEAWNEAIARKRPDVPLFVLGQALPGACSLRDLLSRLANGIPSGSPIELNILTSEYSDEIRSAMDQGASKWSQLVNEVQCSLPPGQELRYQADAKADDVLRCLRRGFDTENIIFLGDSSFSSSSLRSNSSKLPLFEEVAVGGTFDHLHPGHTLLLTVAASLCGQEMTIGITSQQLLRGKKLHEHLLFDFDTRVGHVRSYLGNMFPSLKLDIHSLEDACGPAITKPQLQAIVVSSETLAGALKINEIRKERGMSSLAIVVVERRDAVILSSSFIRQQLHDRSVPN
jgi:phosphopantetheine adenylyltransferase